MCGLNTVPEFSLSLLDRLSNGRLRETSVTTKAFEGTPRVVKRQTHIVTHSPPSSHLSPGGGGPYVSSLGVNLYTFILYWTFSLWCHGSRYVKPGPSFIRAPRPFSLVVPTDSHHKDGTGRGAEERVKFPGQGTCRRGT